MKKSGISKLLFLFAFVIVLAGCDILNKEEIEDKYLVSFAKQGSYFPALIKEFYANIDDDYPEVKPIADAVEHSVQVYTITYKTTFDGEEIIASGLVSVPVSSGSYPIISFQNGTNTLNSEAPSVNPDAALFRLLETIASTGFIVSVPDYLGFGESSSMFHPYLDKESTVQAVTDMLRAVGELVDNHLKVKKNNDLYIMGYSQGGWATMTLQKAIETEMAGEFNLKASACGAGPYDLNLVNDYVLSQTNYPMPYYIGYIFNSYIKLGDITNTPSDVFKAPYADRVLTLFDGTKSGEEINAQLTTKTTDLYTAEFLSGYKTNPKFSSVVSSLQKNSVTAWKTNVPTLLMHGSADNYVPPTTSENLFAGFKSQGVSTSVVNYVPIPGAGHSSGVIPACTAAIKWFIDLEAAN